MTWNSLISDDYWTVSLIEVNIEGSRSIPISVNKAIIDSGTSYIIVPKQDFSYISGSFSKSRICGIDAEYNLYTCLCEADYD